VTRRAAALAAIVTMCAALAVSVPGCTVLGFVAGHRHDVRNGRGGPERLVGVRVGTRVRLTLRDGTSVSGRFAGAAPDSGATPTAGVRPGGIVRIARDGIERAVPADSIARVDVHVPPVGAVSAMLLGLGVDVMAVEALNQPKAPSSGTSGCEDEWSLH
jgi:hypothetical protein